NEETATVIENEDDDSFDLGSVCLEQCNVKRVVPERVLVVKFLPCEGVKLVAAGHKDGNVGFWNLDCQNEEEDGGVSLFKPHTYSVTSLVFQQNSFSKINQSYDFSDVYCILGFSVFLYDFFLLNPFAKVATTLVSFFETCNADPSHWEKISDGGLERIYERYTWKKYSERLLTLAGVYSFWKHVSKLERRETRRYLEMFYSLKFRDLVSVIHSSFFQFLRLVYLYDHITTC
ncbi:unnamed protein product, partial [Brassica napus]